MKKIELYAFDNKTKSINAHIPEKIKIFIETNLSKEIEYFQKKYIDQPNAKSAFSSSEYKIELLTKVKNQLKL